jgi:hypothetical protein
VFLASRPDLVEQVLVTDANHTKHFGGAGSTTDNQPRNDCFWHNADILNAPTTVRFGGNADSDQPPLTNHDL